ncbi:riboflavin synthase [Virgibacillus sp. 179-BFC.A HS]|uniref:Riboflavin synthase n=1 Tax=Tigheibacillus jepli TaxID=3035914 RepID=A0ABU5CFU9_9BACI|nr:riboflavin synthase [Virgibacillus sp. 179-BFC.A HS]MDY0405178.1 riboflavin synthase [Virgibacillus sp. 179-BFC.A HS]
MFTGIIEDIGHVKRIERNQKTMRLAIQFNQMDTDGLKVGDSIAVNGTCLTVAQLDKDGFTADVMPETFHRTNLGVLKINAPVNMERALKVSDRLDGHFVTGHVDTVVRLLDKKQEQNALEMTFALPPQQKSYVVQKGSVALDGTSLTVAEVTSASFSVSLIPHTQEHTTLAGKRPGEMVNMETDILGKYIVPLQNNQATDKIDKAFLMENGF